MKALSGITDYAFQRLKIKTSYGPVEVTLRYYTTQMAWYMDVEWDNFTLRSRKVVVHPNLLRPWRKVIPFGLSCISNTGADPRSLEAFSSGAATLYFAETEDLQSLEMTK